MTKKPQNMKNNQEDNQSAVDLSRRRLAKAGLIAAPIMSTLPGKSALAQNCTTLSGIMSGNLSAVHGITEAPCGGEIIHTFGLSPGYWRTILNNNHSFPSGLNARTLTLSTAETLSFLPYDEKTLLKNLGAGSHVMMVPSSLQQYSVLEALWLKNKHTVEVGDMELINFTRHTIAAFFSALSSSEYFMGPEQVIDIYNSITTFGIYVEPVTGAELTQTEIVEIYEGSYVGEGDVEIDRSVNFDPCAGGYKYDDSRAGGNEFTINGSGHIYYKTEIQEFSSDGSIETVTKYLRIDGVTEETVEWPYEDKHFYIKDNGRGRRCRSLIDDLDD